MASGPKNHELWHNPKILHTNTMYIENPQNYLTNVTIAEMLTLNVALQEYERHFSGIWGHFPECCVFFHKSTKCTHTSFL